MSGRVAAVLEVLRGMAVAGHALGTALVRVRWRFAIVALLGLLAIALYRRPPFATAGGGEVLVRTNALDGTVTAYTGGTAVVIPGIHQVRRYSIRDQVFRLTDGASASGPAPFQSMEGLSIGVDLTVRWAIDQRRVARLSKDFPDDLNADLVRPAVQAIAYPLFARYTVRDIFSGRRSDIQRQLTSELTPKLAALGLQLRSVSMGQVDLPADYRAGMEKLLAEELETEKVRYTLQLKEAQVKQTQLESDADKVRRETAAEAAGREQIIAARAQEETMKHILPFKQKQIEQRQLEAEADKVARIRTAEGAAQARRIEAQGEADSRQKLAEAEAYRVDLVGKANAGQMEREGALITHYPLLIQKTLADKLSDKVQVIIAPTPAAGHFIGSGIVGDDTLTGGVSAATGSGARPESRP